MIPNPTATAGFIFALMAICFGWVPCLGGFLWLMGVAFSLGGLLNRKPRSLSVAGLVVSGLWFTAYLVTGSLFGSYDSFTLYPYTLW